MVDNNSTDGTDKRSWRERLGIGNKEMPKISDDFKAPGSAPVMPRAPVVGASKVAPRGPAPISRANPVAKSVPMAPRVAPKAAPVERPVAAPIAAPASISGAALASKLQSQKEAAERLAKQRMQQVRAKPIQNNDDTNAHDGGKPKFIFADEEPPRVIEVPPVQKTTLPPRPVTMPPPSMPQMAPARPPLGAERPVAPPRPSLPQQPVQQPPQQQQPAYMPPPAYAPPQPQPYQQYPQGQPYQAPQQPAYRPIPPQQSLPQQGYAPVDQGYQNPPPQQQTSMQPSFGQRGFAPPPQQQPMQSGPRLNVPPRAPSYQPGYDAGVQQQAPEQGFSRLPRRPMRSAAPMPQAPEFDPPYPGEADVFATAPQPRGRRASAQDYGQAYREADMGYEDEEPKSRAPLLMVLALLTSLALAGGLVWFYQMNKAKVSGGAAATTTEQPTAPVVEAQPEPPKVTADPPAEGGASPSTKQIYDRIVGDKEVLGNNLTPTEEAPLEQNVITDPQPATGVGGAEEAAPLPLPPPPGEGGAAGNDQQGALDTQKTEPVQTAAAGESQAAVLPQGNGSAALASDSADGKQDVSAAPEPTSELASDAAATQAPVPGDGIGETDSALADPEAAVMKPVVKKVVAEKKRAQPKKLRSASLGAKPVVLVAPQKKAQRVATAPMRRARAVQSDDAVQNDADGAGLYGEDFQSVSAQQPVLAAPAATPKKKTLLTIFENDSDATGSAELDTVASVAPKPLIRAPTGPVQVASAGTGYVAQLASFASESDARRAASGLKSKYPTIVGKYPTVISSGTVAGTTRYRLALGALSSQSAANQLCSQLIAAGERDCLAKRQ